MRFVFLVLVAVRLASTAAAQSPPHIDTADIDRFWRAYDAVHTTTDSARQIALIDSLYVTPGSPGLVAMRAARRYTTVEYRRAMLSLPKFWASLRPNALRARMFADSLRAAFVRLQSVYPAFRAPRVTFVMGVFRSGGTFDTDNVLIGAEIAMADSTVDTSEFPPSIAHLRAFMARNRLSMLPFLTVHEAVHTQQRAQPHLLLQRSLAEGIAEYVAVQAMAQPSTAPAIAYERMHRDSVRSRFVLELLSGRAVDRWMYSATNTPFGVRDLGYAVGYAVAEGYVARSRDTLRAVRELIELDYADSLALARIVDGSGYLRRSLRAELATFERKRRPRVTRVTPQPRRGATLAPGRTEFAVTFSQPMDTVSRGFDFGPGGEATVMRVERMLGWSPDRRTVRFESTLPPARQLDVTLSERFVSADGISIRPYPIAVRTR
jgi:hypothetical protein